MRLRLGRGLPRHNLQAVMDMEDFVYNRTNGDPQAVFKALGEAGVLYMIKYDPAVIRTSMISTELRKDNIVNIPSLTVEKIKRLCSDRVYERGGKYKVYQSDLISTTVDLDRNTIRGEIKRAYIYDQLIFWDRDVPYSPFNLETIAVYCDCKYFLNETRNSGYCCSHIIGQFRRVLFLNGNNLP